MAPDLRRPLSCLALLCLLGGAGLAQPPVINEFMGSNATTIADDDGDFSDWIELYNPAENAFDLTDCYLSDDAARPLRWRFPGGSIPAGGFLLVWASGKDRQSAGGDLHTNFAISAAGEPLLLTAPDGTTRLDEVPPIGLATDVSYGRLPDGAGTWTLFAVPTPGTANSGGGELVPAPAFSHEPGFYTSPIALALTVDDPEAVVTYTLDGSVPTQASAVFAAPLELAGRAGEPNGISLIPTNFRQGDFWSWRPPRGEVFKVHVVRARAFRDGGPPSEVATGTFVVDPDPANHLPLPVVSLVTEPANLFDDVIGIYVPGVNFVPWDEGTGNYHQTGDAWERPVHVELFDLQGGRLLAQDAGVRIHGGWTRQFPQKTLRLYARAQYGPSRFDCALFPDLPYTSYNRFLIRNAGNDWGRVGFRDLAVQTMVAGMGFDTQAGRPVLHFINGEAWGLANLRERYDRHYLVRCFGVAEDEVVLLENNALLDEGLPSDRDDYLALRSFVATQDMTDPANLAYVAERIDLENFIAYSVAEIFIGNQDWPGNNIRFWRRRTPSYEPLAPPGHDGRWRWLMFDVDVAFTSVTYNSLAHATAADGPNWPNPPWSTQLLRGLLASSTFRYDFINAIADHLNSTFLPARLVGIIDAHAALYAPTIAAWQDRWDIAYNWTTGVQAMRSFAQNRSFYQRQHVVAKFQLPGTTTITLGVNDPAQGSLRINGLVIDEHLPGLADPAAPYPWNGIYFQDVPVTVTALPAPGHRFVAWAQDGSTQPIRSFWPSFVPIALDAVFAPDESAPVVLHAWHFNDLPAGTLTEVPADLSLLGGAVLSYPGDGAGYLDRVTPGSELGAPAGTPAGYALRARNPSAARELVLSAPSTGHEGLALRYAAMRTVNGAELHSVHCRVDPAGAWHLVAEDVAVTESFQLFAHDLSAIVGTADNPELTVRLVFGGANAAGDAGNQRFDNFALVGSRPAGANLPPLVVQPVGLQHAIESGPPLVLDLGTVLADPDGDPLVFAATSGDPAAASTAVEGNLLRITPLRRGDVTITVSATDGLHDPTGHAFRVLIHPRAAILAAGPISFTAWDPDQPERTYPPHMLFLQSTVDDPGPDEPLLFPYHIAHDDYHADDQQTIGFPYNNTGRTRIDGLDEDGVAFINTGRGRDLGGALLALDTRGVDEVLVAWLAGTLLPNDRIYAIRLQYRLAPEAPFSDLLIDGAPQAYLRSDQPGDTQVFAPVALPAELLGRSYVQLLWRYHHVAGSSGQRAKLRLDEIVVVRGGTTGVDATSPPQTTVLHGNAPNPFNPATTISFSVRAGSTARLAIHDSRGRRVRTLGEFAAGRHAVAWDGTDEVGARCASGVYFYRLTGAGPTLTAKMSLVK